MQVIQQLLITIALVSFASYLFWWCWYHLYNPMVYRARLKKSLPESLIQPANHIRALYRSVNGKKLTGQWFNLINLQDNRLYGDVDSHGLLEIIHIVNLDSAKKFIDLGSGTGKAVLTMALAYPKLRSKGIEIDTRLHTKAMQMRQRMLNRRFDIGETDFICDDFLSQDWYDSDVVFTHATAFTHQLWHGLIKKFLLLKPGSIIISCSRTIDDNNFKCIQSGNRLMAWGTCRVFIYQRLRAPSSI